LQPKPFDGLSLADQLRRVAQDAMANTILVEVDHERQRLNLAMVIHQNAEGFIDLYCRETGVRSGTMLGTLLHMAESKRREWLNTAVGYPLGKIPFDRRLNRWTRTTSGRQDGR
jgi:hypothetical protein